MSEEIKKLLKPLTNDKKIQAPVATPENKVWNDMDYLQDFRMNTYFLLGQILGTTMRTSKSTPEMIVEIQNLIETFRRNRELQGDV